MDSKMKKQETALDHDVGMLPTKGKEVVRRIREQALQTVVQLYRVLVSPLGAGTQSLSIEAIPYC